MKVIVLATIICLMVYSTVSADTLTEIAKKLITSFDECVQETNPPDEEIKMIKALKGLPTSAEGKCTIACMMKKFKILNSDGKYDHQVTLQLVQDIPDSTKDKILATIPLCDKEVIETSNQCDYAVSIVQCAYKYRAKVGL